MTVQINGEAIQTERVIITLEDGRILDIDSDSIIASENNVDNLLSIKMLFGEQK